MDANGMPGISRPAKTNKIVSWALWDWASAAFNAVATTFVFSVYLTTDGMFTTSEVANQYLSWGTTVAGVIIAVLAPITGQRTDRNSSGVKWLGWFSFGVFLTLCAMFFVAPDSALGPIGALWLGIGLLGLGNIFFEFASVHYNAMLNDLSTTANRGKISGFGWGLGYVGGIVLLLFLYFGFINPEVGLFGVTSANGQNVRVSMLFAALWYGIFTLPVLLNPPKRAAKPPANLEHQSLAQSYRQLWRTVVMLAKEAPETLKFLIASAVFRDGLAGVFTFGGVIAASVFGFSSGQVIIFAIAANLVAGVATIGFGVIDDKWGSKRMIVVSLILMSFLGLAIFFLHDLGATVFWVFGLLLCVFVGPTQSASRTFLANVIPAGRAGEVFGLYATTGRAVSFLSPFMYGLAIAWGSRFASGDATYWGIIGIVLVLFVGLLLLLPVKAGEAHFGREQQQSR